MPAGGSVHVPFVQSRPPRQRTPESEHVPPAPASAVQTIDTQCESGRQSPLLMQAAPFARPLTHFIVASSQCWR